MTSLTNITSEFDGAYGVHKVYGDDGRFVAEVAVIQDGDAEVWTLAWGNFDALVEREFPTLDAALVFADTHIDALDAGEPVAD